MNEIIMLYNGKRYRYADAGETDNCCEKCAFYSETCCDVPCYNEIAGADGSNKVWQEVTK